MDITRAIETSLPKGAALGAARQAMTGSKVFRAFGFQETRSGQWEATRGGGQRGSIITLQVTGAMGRPSVVKVAACPVRTLAANPFRPVVMAIEKDLPPVPQTPAPSVQIPPPPDAGSNRYAHLPPPPKLPPPPR